MTRYLWLCHSSGGNLTPSLGVARELRDRGHEVAFLLKPETAGRVEAEGLRAIPLTSAYSQIDTYPQMGPMTRIGCSLTSPDVVEEIGRVVASESPDALMIDAMFPAALSVTPASVCRQLCFATRSSGGKWRNGSGYSASSPVCAREPGSTRCRTCRPCGRRRTG